MSTSVKNSRFDPFIKRLLVSLRHDCGVLRGDHLLVGVSGGADSVALLRGLAVVAEGRKWDLKLTVGHVQHHLRAEAEGDAGFVKGLAEALGLKYMREDVDVLGAGGNVEAAARELRYGALEAMARDIGAVAVAVAHHGDDQVETLLMRMMRGSGVKGMGGMAYRRAVIEGSCVGLIRPLLSHGGDEMKGFLERIGQDWREDHTNGDTSRTRSRLRHDVLPVLKEIKGDVAEKVNQLAGQMRAVDGLIMGLAEGLLGEAEMEDGGLDREILKGAHGVVLYEAMRIWLEGRGGGQRVGGEIVRRLVEGVCDGVGGERKFGNVWIRGVWVG